MCDSDYSPVDLGNCKYKCVLDGCQTSSVTYVPQGDDQLLLVKMSVFDLCGSKDSKAEDYVPVVSQITSNPT